jgi:phosphatidylserine decarboxylase
MIQIQGDGYEVALKQIAGLLARRIVCNVKVGDKVARGERIGLIKFGSRCDVLLPPDANLRVRTGSRVKGGSTILAVLPESALPEGNA